MKNRYHRTSYLVINSRTIIFCICLIIPMLNGCKKGDTGPVGPAGPGNVNMYTFSFTAADLIKQGNDSTIYYITLPNSPVANIVSSGAAVLIYMGSKTSPLYALPYTEPHEPTLSITYSFRDNQWLDIDIRTSYNDARGELIGFLNSSTYQLRLIVIPADNVYLAKLGNGKPSYNEIKTMFNLQN